MSLILLAVAMVFDWRQRGRPHQAYVLGGAVLVALRLAEIPLSETAV